MRVYPAIILNEPFASKVAEGIKTIETRMRLFKFSGDIIICCDKGKSKDSSNAGKALCLVNWHPGRPMEDADEVAACIENVPGRYAYPLTDRRLFSYNFNFVDYAVKRNWRWIFQLRVPDFVQILSTDKK